MPKDYANKNAPRKKRGASRQNKKNAKQNSVSLGLRLVTVALVVVLAGGLAYLKWHKPQAQVKATAKDTRINKQESPTNNRLPVPQETDIPFYELHEDLINKQVVIPEDDLKLPDTLDKFYYLMTCGAFREQFRADELKAQIAMTGNNSTIATVQSKGETWYRVQLGPFSRKRETESIRHRLQDNAIQGCLINRHLKKP